MFDIFQIAKSDCSFLKECYIDYLNGGKKFDSYLGGLGGDMNTFNTFIIIAYKFCVHAEHMGLGYKYPAQRMMKLLQVFNPELANRYDQDNDTPEAETFRATLMVTALSYAFDMDLRPEFRHLNFPIDDTTYKELMFMLVE